MKIYRLILAATVLVSCERDGYGLATERIGPDKDQRHPTVEQPGWPAGMIKILGHDSRVYSIWVNGNENFYFKAARHEIGELIKLYSATRLRDHVMTIKQRKKEVRTFQGNKIDYNVNFHFLGGIVLGVMRRKGEAETYEPTLTIYVDADADGVWLREIAIPDNIVVSSEVTGLPVESKATKPNRTLWHAEVVFDDKKPAADFEHGVSTKVTLWEEGAETGFDLGTVSYKGQFSAAFSEQEIARLKTGSMWLTLTVGNQLTAAKKDDAELKLQSMSPDPMKVTAVEVAGPTQSYYFGRLLFEDGSPAILDPLPWPGAEISITFPYAGRITIDEEGYFQVFFTLEQFVSVKARPIRKNIYIPDPEAKGRSTARYAFPALKLSLEKEQAGEIRIERPRPKNEGR
jgi:hypothetical protein